jgi:hypothetical protein
LQSDTTLASATNLDALDLNKPTNPEPRKDKNPLAYARIEELHPRHGSRELRANPADEVKTKHGFVQCDEIGFVM